jgi:hypothetical protein
VAWWRGNIVMATAVGLGAVAVAELL